MVNQRLMLLRISPCQRPCFARNAGAVIAFAVLFWTSTAFAQSSVEDPPPAVVAQKQTSLNGRVFSPQESDPRMQPQANSATTSLDASSLGSIADVKQSKRILWIFPNYRAVSANTHLPPLSLRDKFWLAT